jgi:GcrA cell cycle regulator
LTAAPDHEIKISRTDGAKTAVAIQANSIWTIAHAEQAAALWADGLSAGTIAAQLSAEWRVSLTRNSIIGKAHRCQWGARAPRVTMPRGAPKQLKPAVSSIYRPHTTAPRRIAEPLPPPTAGMIALLDLRFEQCRYPHGDPRSSDFGFCGAQRARSPRDRYEPYCAFHRELCSQSKKQEHNNGPTNFHKKVSTFAIRA